MQLLVAAFFAVLFLQSGIDKLKDRKGNLEWLKEHFGKSSLKNSAPLLLSLLTLLEMAAGLFSGLGSVWMLCMSSNFFIFWGMLLSSLSLLCLFFGQRMAKDYLGAENLVSYFILSLLGLWLTGGAL